MDESGVVFTHVARVSIGQHGSTYCSGPIQNLLEPCRALLNHADQCRPVQTNAVSVCSRTTRRFSSGYPDRNLADSLECFGEWST